MAAPSLSRFTLPTTIGGKQPNSQVEQWASTLPLASTLSTHMPTTLEDVADLTSRQINDVCERFSAHLKQTLHIHCSQLKAALETDQVRRSNSKFNTFEGNFGTVSDFHRQLYEEIGNPNPHWETAMRLEHETNIDTFPTTNYNKLTTCPRAEWSYVVDGVVPPKEAMDHGRVLKSIDSLMALEVASQAALTRPEVIALVLYTGPMFVIYNTILRKYPSDRYDALKAKDGMFPTSIFVLVSAIQKVSRVMVLRSGQSLYRGVDGNMTLPPHFTDPDIHGCLGMMEYGFMSTTEDLSVAVSYTNIAKGRAHPKVLEIRIGSVDRGADIRQFSQYPGEAEYLWAPHAFIEPVGGNKMLVTEHGIVEVIPVRVNANLKAVTLEEYQGRKKEMHMASFKILVQDLVHQLDERLNGADMRMPQFYDDKGFERIMSQQDKAKELVSSIVAQCEQVRSRHEAMAATEFNDDTVYRGLVTEMLEMQMHALVKVDYVVSALKKVMPLHLEYPLRDAFRDQMDHKGKMVKSNRSADLALDLCKKYGLLRKDVDEVNEVGETPLIVACADGVRDNKVELLLMAGCDVNARSDDGSNALFVSNMYGHASLVQVLADHGATIECPPNKYGFVAVLAAAENGHTACLELMHKLGADVNRAREDGWGGVNRPRDDGFTPLLIAAENGHVACIELLHKLGADVNKARSDGATPVWAAAERGHAACVEALLSKGADANMACNGLTPLMIATSRGHTAVVGVFTAAQAANVAEVSIAVEVLSST